MRPRRSPAARVGLAAGICALVVALLGGCGAITTTIDTEQALTNAGYQSVSVNFSVGNGDTVKVSVTVNASPSQTNSDDVARIVWQKFHERFGLLAVTVHGTGAAFQRDYSYSDLVSMFGPRNPAFDKTSVTSATERLGLIVIIVVVLLIASAVLIVVLVRRGRRNRQRPPWYPGGPPWGPGGPFPGGQAPGGPPPPWVQGGPPAGDQAPVWPPAPPPPPGSN